MERQAGLLLHVTSLPSKEGIGTLGKEAYEFVDFLAKSGIRVWQVLPLVPTLAGNSPYQSVASGALNPLLIDLQMLAEKGLLTAEEAKCGECTNKVDYTAINEKKKSILRLAFSRFDTQDKDFISFEQKGVFREYAIFCTIWEANEYKAFWDWADGLNIYDSTRVEEFIKAHYDKYLYYVFTQYVFFQQWQNLKKYANQKNIKILGDMPIYLALNSVEVWAHKERFLLDAQGKPSMVAGVPPDYFNENGQLWGNPLYNWEEMAKDGYKWWHERIDRELTMFDMLRIDHFRGLDRFYAIDAKATDAKNGVWLKAPGVELFKGYEDAPIVAEDLGYIDDSFREMLFKSGYPGMKVYSFGLDCNPWSEHKPINFPEKSVVYTGTHDNAPFRETLDEMGVAEHAIAVSDILSQARAVGVQEDIDDNVALTKTAWKTLLKSRAQLAIVPMQDFLALGKESRMNIPAVVGDENWAWRVDKAMLTDEVANEILCAVKDAQR